MKKNIPSKQKEDDLYKIKEKIRNNIDELVNAPEIIINDIKFISELIESVRDIQVPLVLKYSGDVAKQEEQLVIKAANKNIDSFQYASDSLKQNKQFIFKFVENGGKAFRAIDKKWQRDKDIIAHALQFKHPMGSEVYVDPTTVIDLEDLKKGNKDNVEAFRKIPNAYFDVVSKAQPFVLHKIAQYFDILIVRQLKSNIKEFKENGISLMMLDSNTQLNNKLLDELMLIKDTPLPLLIKHGGNTFIYYAATNDAGNTMRMFERVVASLGETMNINELFEDNFPSDKQQPGVPIVIKGGNVPWNICITISNQADQRIIHLESLKRDIPGLCHGIATIDSMTEGDELYKKLRAIAMMNVSSDQALRDESDFELLKSHEYFKGVLTKPIKSQEEYEKDYEGALKRHNASLKNSETNKPFMSKEEFINKEKSMKMTKEQFIDQVLAEIIYYLALTKHYPKDLSDKGKELQEAEQQLRFGDKPDGIIITGAKESGKMWVPSESKYFSGNFSEEMFKTLLELDGNWFITKDNIPRLFLISVTSHTFTIKHFAGKWWFRDSDAHIDQGFSNVRDLVHAIIQDYPDALILKYESFKKDGKERKLSDKVYNYYKNIFRKGNEKEIMQLISRGGLINIINCNPEVLKDLWAVAKESHVVGESIVNALFVRSYLLGVLKEEGSEAQEILHNFLIPMKENQLAMQEFVRLFGAYDYGKTSCSYKLVAHSKSKILMDILCNFGEHQNKNGDTLLSLLTREALLYAKHILFEEHQDKNGDTLEALFYDKHKELTIFLKELLTTQDPKIRSGIAYSLNLLKLKSPKSYQQLDDNLTKLDIKEWEQFKTNVIDLNAIFENGSNKQLKQIAQALALPPSPGWFDKVSKKRAGAINDIRKWLLDIFYQEIIRSYKKITLKERPVNQYQFKKEQIDAIKNKLAARIDELEGVIELKGKKDLRGEDGMFFSYRYEKARTAYQEMKKEFYGEVRQLKKAIFAGVLVTDLDMKKTANIKGKEKHIENFRPSF
jgi:hypothetical protein